jgi:adenine phosphoribosyltransferase
MKTIAAQLRSFKLHDVTFWDFESITEDGHKWNHLIDTMVSHYKDQAIDYVVCLDARGFLLGGAIASALGRNVGIKLVRKKGKLPGPVRSFEYGLEYRDKDVVEIQDSDVLKGKRVLMVDDVLATGGTASAGVGLIEQVGGEIAGIAFAIELPSLEGRSKLLDYNVTSEISIIDGEPCADVEYCVDILATNQESELVLIQRLNNPVGHALPGGRIDLGRSARETVSRELSEETGFCAGDITYFKALVGKDRDPRGPKVSLVFKTNIVAGKKRGEAGKTRVFTWETSSETLPDEAMFAFDHGSVVHEYVTNL